MADNLEDVPPNVPASDSEDSEGESEDESEDEMRQNLEFNFGQVQLGEDQAKGTKSMNMDHFMVYFIRYDPYLWLT